MAFSRRTRRHKPVSALAGIGAADRWVMTVAFALAGGCEIVTGLALWPAGITGRLMLAAGGAAGIMVVAYPVRMGDGAPGSHIAWAVAGLAALAVWPALASRHGQAVPWALRPEVSVRVTVVLLILLAWFGLELVTSGGLAGLAERVLGEAQSAWPFAAVMSCRHQVTLTAHRRRYPAPRPAGAPAGRVGRDTGPAAGRGPGSVPGRVGVRGGTGYLAGSADVVLSPMPRTFGPARDDASPRCLP